MNRAALTRQPCRRAEAAEFAAAGPADILIDQYIALRGCPATLLADERPPLHLGELARAPSMIDRLGVNKSTPAPATPTPTGAGRTWCVRHGDLRFARLFFRQQRQSSNARLARPCAEARRNHRTKTTAQPMAPVKRLDSTTEEEGDRASTSGERDGLISPFSREFLVFQIRTASARSILFFGMGGKGEPTGRESGNEST